MSGTTVQQIAPSYTIPEPGVAPGAAATPINLVLTAAQPVAVININTQPTGTVQLTHIQTLKIDNSIGPIPLIVTFPDTGDQINVQPYEYGYYPCHTNSLVFTIAAPLLPSLQFQLNAPGLSVKMQALNYYVAPQTAKAISATSDLGYTVQLNLPPPANNPWNILTAPVPGPPGTVFTTIYSTNFDTIGYTLYIQGNSIDGANWTVALKPGVLAEYDIPPTAAGSPLNCVALLPSSNGGRTKTTSTPAFTFRQYPLGLPPVEAVGTLGNYTSGILSGGPGFISAFNNTTIGNPQSFVKVESGMMTLNSANAVVAFAESQGGVVSNLWQGVGASTPPAMNIPIGPMEWFSSGLGWSLGIFANAALGGNVELTVGLRFTAASQLAHA